MNRTWTISAVNRDELLDMVVGLRFQRNGLAPRGHAPYTSLGSTTTISGKRRK